MIATDNAPVCAECDGDESSCECVVACDFCRRDCWHDEVERVDHLYLNRFYRCDACRRGGC